MAIVLVAQAAAASGPAPGVADAGAGWSDDAPVYLAVAKGRTYKSSKHGFAITPPSGWVIKSGTSKFVVQLNAKSEEAYIFVDYVRAEKEVTLNKNLVRFIKKQLAAVKKSFRGFNVMSTRPTMVGRHKAYVAVGYFHAGQNKVATSIYFVPKGRKLFIITTMCPKLLESKWRQYFLETVATFRITS